MAEIDLNISLGTKNGSIPSIAGSVYGQTWDELASLVSGMVGTPINDYCDFTMRNMAYMGRLLAINYYEGIRRNNSLGSSIYSSDSMPGAADGPTAVSSYTYATFARNISVDEQRGENTTRQKVAGPNVYPQNENLYPDDLGYGTYDNKWVPTDTRSIIAKTKKLFNENKINTIIDRFSTNGDKGSNNPLKVGDSGTTAFGMSHGNGLLKKSAEIDPSADYSINGYQNPYCRVWTHHHQYDKYSKVMRPFSDGESTTAKLSNIHTWSDYFDKGDSKYGWKDGSLARHWNRSVLDDNTTMVNITPSYRGGGFKNIHARDCMFSIENLAWKGYDPYAFEQALSWEQRGPHGGRIMWFPPYGISFTESTQAQWENTTFIGRGEPVYTYSNTTRTGTLSFILLTDHPSSIDYATWYMQDGDNTIKENDLRRYFAGCGAGDASDPGSGSLGYINAATRPTPMTDEKYQLNAGVKKKEDDNERGSDEDNVKEVVFYTFYPNNYSGLFDRRATNLGRVEPVAYLLFGTGAQKQALIDTSKSGEVNDLNTDLPIDFTLSNTDTSAIRGYEMDATGISVSSDNKNAIVRHTAQKPNKKKTGGLPYVWPAKSYAGEGYIPTNDKDNKYYYRIDGSYDRPDAFDRSILTISNEEEQVARLMADEGTKNTYIQKFINTSSYKDSKTYRLNLSTDNVKGSVLDNGNDNNHLYSLAEVACGLFKATGHYDSAVSILESKGLDSDRVGTITELFKDYKLESIECVGYSNSHGNNIDVINQARNNILAKERAQTIADFIRENAREQYANANTNITYQSSQQVAGTENTNDGINGKVAKLYRSCRCVLRFKANDTKLLSETESENASNTYSVGYDYASGNNNDKRYNNIFQRGYTPIKAIIDGDATEYTSDIYQTHNNMWSKDERSGEFKSVQPGEEVTVESTDDVSQEMIKDGYYFRKTGFKDPGDNSEYNYLRYDQEYHFFKQLQVTDSLVYNDLMKKLKFFDPAFHSMTPEGFNARLTFLEQCMRQGDTVTSSDPANKSASNLAFGRPPFCVLRLGDFYNQLIVIRSVQKDYSVSDGLTWDLNPEGVGVQPMLCKVTLNFDFIGGGDLEGPVRRLQNALSFNYYANASLYDNRADIPNYEMKDPMVMGANDGNPLRTDK